MIRTELKMPQINPQVNNRHAIMILVRTNFHATKQKKVFLRPCVFISWNQKYSILVGETNVIVILLFCQNSFQTCITHITCSSCRSNYRRKKYLVRPSILIFLYKLSTNKESAIPTKYQKTIQGYPGPRPQRNL